MAPPTTLSLARTLAAVLVVACMLPPTAAQQLNTAPVIGILSVPLDGAELPCITATQPPSNYPQDGAAASCFTAFYSKWIESAGARVVVIPYNANTTTLDALFASINGILFTGGGVPLFFNTTYLSTAQYLFDKVLAANKAGDYFPLHGTCMGFQTISILAAHNESVLALNAFDSENISWPLAFTDAAWESRVIGDAPAFVQTTFASTNSTLNLHHDGVPPSAYTENPRMQSLLTMLATNVDRRGRPFVSMWEGKGVPITATQFHPERPIFEWVNNIGINHAPDVVLANRYLADFFVEQARHSTHVFNPSLSVYSIYSYAATLVHNGDAGEQRCRR